MDEGASSKGTTLWKLCSRGWKFFKYHLYRIPGNGKRIGLWEDKIMGLQPLKLQIYVIGSLNMASTSWLIFPLRTLVGIGLTGLSITSQIGCILNMTSS